LLPLLGFACLALALWPGLVWAAPAPSYPDLLRQSTDKAPRLVEGEANVRVAQAQADQAGVPPNPVVGFEVENLGARDIGGLSQRQDTLSISQAIELGGKRSARLQSGRAEVLAARAKQQQAKADFAYDLALAYGSAEMQQRRAKLLEGDLARAREDVRAARALVQAGKEADLRAVQAQAAASGADADAQAAKADAAEALARLSSLVGSSELFTEVQASLLDIVDAEKTPPAEPPPSMPVIVVAEAERDAAARRISVERAAAIPDVTVSLGARRFEGQSGGAVVAGISAPLPLFDQNRGAVTAANARLNAADARLNAARLDAQADWRAASAQANAGHARLKAASEAQSAAQESYTLSRIGYDAGRTSLLELSGARRALVEAEARLLDAKLARLRAEATLARLAGRIPFGDQ
jgi:cobalt-zinc-cadmium efflux system outer membrane protein